MLYIGYNFNIGQHERHLTSYSIDLNDSYPTNFSRPIGLHDSYLTSFITGLHDSYLTSFSIGLHDIAILLALVQAYTIQLHVSYQLQYRPTRYSSLTSFSIGLHDSYLISYSIGLHDSYLISFRIGLHDSYLNSFSIGLQPYMIAILLALQHRPTRQLS